MSGWSASKFSFACLFILTATSSAEKNSNYILLVDALTVLISLLFNGDPLLYLLFCECNLFPPKLISNNSVISSHFPVLCNLHVLSTRCFQKRITGDQIKMKTTARNKENQQKKHWFSCNSPHCFQLLPQSALKCSLWSAAGGFAQTAVPASAKMTA